MTVAELIELLKTMPSNAKVLHLNIDNEYGGSYSTPRLDLLIGSAERQDALVISA